MSIKNILISGKVFNSVKIKALVCNIAKCTVWDGEFHPCPNQAISSATSWPSDNSAHIHLALATVLEADCSLLTKLRQQHMLNEKQFY